MYVSDVERVILVALLVFASFAFPQKQISIPASATMDGSFDIGCPSGYNAPCGYIMNPYSVISKGSLLPPEYGSCSGANPLFYGLSVSFSGGDPKICKSIPYNGCQGGAIYCPEDVAGWTSPEKKYS